MGLCTLQELVASGPRATRPTSSPPRIYVSFRQGCLNHSVGFVSVAILVLEDPDGRNRTWTVAGRFVAGAEPVSGVAGTAEGRRADSATALDAGGPAGESARRESHRRGAQPPFLQREETGRGGRHPAAVGRTCVRRVDFTGHGCQAVPV